METITIRTTTLKGFQRMIARHNEHRVDVSLPPVLHDRFSRECRIMGISPQSCVIELIEQYVGSWVPKDGIKNSTVPRPFKPRLDKK